MKSVSFDRKRRALLKLQNKIDELKEKAKKDLRALQEKCEHKRIAVLESRTSPNRRICLDCCYEEESYYSSSNYHSPALISMGTTLYEMLEEEGFQKNEDLEFIGVPFDRRDPKLTEYPVKIFRSHDPDSGSVNLDTVWEFFSHRRLK